MDYSWSVDARWNSRRTVLPGDLGHGESCSNGVPPPSSDVQASQALTTALAGCFLLFLGIDLLVNTTEGMSLGLRFLFDGNASHAIALQSYRSPISTRMLLACIWIFTCVISNPVKPGTASSGIRRRALSTAWQVWKFRNTPSLRTFSSLHAPTDRDNDLDLTTSPTPPITELSHDSIAARIQRRYQQASHDETTPIPLMHQSSAPPTSHRLAPPPYIRLPSPTASAPVLQPSSTSPYSPRRLLLSSPWSSLLPTTLSKFLSSPAVRLPQADGWIRNLAGAPQSTKRDVRKAEDRRGRILARPKRARRGASRRESPFRPSSSPARRNRPQEVPTLRGGSTEDSSAVRKPVLLPPSRLPRQTAPGSSDLLSGASTTPAVNRRRLPPFAPTSPPPGPQLQPEPSSLSPSRLPLFRTLLLRRAHRIFPHCLGRRRGFGRQGNAGPDEERRPLGSGHMIAPPPAASPALCRGQKEQRTLLETVSIQDSYNPFSSPFS